MISKGGRGPRGMGMEEQDRIEARENVSDHRRVGV